MLSNQFDLEGTPATDQPLMPCPIKSSNRLQLRGGIQMWLVGSLPISSLLG